MRATVLTILPQEREAWPAAAPSAPQPSKALVPATATGNAMPSIESVILHKLLTELEARDIARVPGAYRLEPPRPTHQTILVRALWSSLWALSLVLCIFVVKYIDSQNTARTVDMAQSQSIHQLAATLDDQKNEFSKIVDSLHGMTEAIASTSARTAAIPDILRRLSTGLRQTASLPVVETAEHGAAVASPTIIKPFQPEGLTEISFGGHHHHPMEDAVAPPDVTVHHNYLGVMDYWLVPRVTSGVRTMIKVIPVAQGSAGIFVHDVDEVKDYVVTPSGDWVAVADPDGRQ